MKLGSERLVLPRGSRALGEPSRRVIHLQQRKATSDPGPWPARRCRRSAPPPPALPSAPDADAGTGAAHRAGLGAQARLAQVDGEEAWERELCRFIWVLAVVRDSAPCLRHWVSWGGR